MVSLLSVASDKKKKLLEIYNHDCRQVRAFAPVNENDKAFYTQRGQHAKVEARNLGILITDVIRESHS